jgi:hypothetical protein
MKVLMIVLAVAAGIAGLAVGCGPQKDYCPDNTTGQCIDAGNMMPPPMPDSGIGESIIINEDGGT